MTNDEVRERLAREPDFVNLPRFNFSLKNLTERYPDGVPDKLIAQALALEEDDVEALFQTALKKLRRSMGIRRG